MKVTCESCKKTISVPDEKIPDGKDLTFKCPGCKNPITVRKWTNPPSGPGLPEFSGVPDTTPASQPLDETRNVILPPAAEDTSKLAAITTSLENEMDMLEEGAKRALVADEDNLDRIAPVLKKMEYAVSTVKTCDEALKKMAFNRYDIVIINERFEGSDPVNNPILKSIEPMTMDIRRKFFVVVIGKNFRTLDNMTAFAKSVNMVMNADDFQNFELILKKALKDYENFYALFNRTLVETGKETKI